MTSSSSSSPSLTELLYKDILLVNDQRNKDQIYPSNKPFAIRPLLKYIARFLGSKCANKILVMENGVYKGVAQSLKHFEIYKKHRTCDKIKQISYFPFGSSIVLKHMPNKDEHIATVLTLYGEEYKGKWLVFQDNKFVRMDTIYEDAIFGMSGAFYCVRAPAPEYIIRKKMEINRVQQHKKRKSKLQSIRQKRYSKTVDFCSNSEFSYVKGLMNYWIEKQKEVSVSRETEYENVYSWTISLKKGTIISDFIDKLQIRFPLVTTQDIRGYFVFTIDDDDYASNEKQKQIIQTNGDINHSLCTNESECVCNQAFVSKKGGSFLKYCIEQEKNSYILFLLSQFDCKIGIEIIDGMDNMVFDIIKAGTTPHRRCGQWIRNLGEYSHTLFPLLKEKCITIDDLKKTGSTSWSSRIEPDRIKFEPYWTQSLSSPIVQAILSKHLSTKDMEKIHPDCLSSIFKHPNFTKVLGLSYFHNSIKDNLLKNPESSVNIAKILLSSKWIYIFTDTKNIYNASVKYDFKKKILYAFSRDNGKEIVSDTVVL